MAKKIKQQDSKAEVASKDESVTPDDESGVQSVQSPFDRTAKIKRFVFRFSIAFVTLLFAIPFCLLLLYKIESVKPISTIMVRDALVGPGSRRDWVELDDMSPHIVRSVMMSEDGQFCAHGGVDWTALNQVIDDALDGEKTRGASTITMQLVKKFVFMARPVICSQGVGNSVCSDDRVGA